MNAPNTYPLVSVILTNFNSSKYIQKSLGSILSQTYQNIEIIVIDDASADDSIVVIKDALLNRGNTVILNNNVNMGYLYSFNKALLKASGDYICFLDSDDFIADVKISKQIDFLINNPDIDCVGTGFAKFFDDKIYDTVIFANNDEEIKEFLQNEIDVCFCGSSVMISKRVKEEIGGYRDFFSRCPAEDFDWLRRISDNFKVANLKETLYFYRLNPDSISRAFPDNHKRAFAHYYAKFFHEQRKLNNGNDSISSKYLESSLNSFNEYIESKYDKHVKFFTKRDAVNHIIAGRYSEARSLLSSIYIKSGLKQFFFCVVLLILFTCSSSFFRMRILAFANRIKKVNPDVETIKALAGKNSSTPNCK